MDGPFLYAYLHLCMLNSPYRHSTLFVMLNLPMICKHEFVCKPFLYSKIPMIITPEWFQQMRLTMDGHWACKG